MDIEKDVLYGMVVGVVFPLVLWVLYKWKTINADGVITLDEVIETITEAQDVIEDAVEVIECLMGEGDGE